MKDIRLLKASEIDCRVSQVAKDNTWCSVLLFKDARVDMRLLDEVFGPNNWQRTHEIINGQLFCNIDIWDEDKKCWIRKQDVGTESMTEAEKGRASDSFKRAGFNVGIGRELYTAPSIYINLSESDLNKMNKVKTRFALKSITYDSERNINSLVIIDDKGKVRYKYGSGVLNTEKIQDKEVDKTMSPELELAYQEIKEAKSVKDLGSIYSRWTGMQSDECFINLIKERRKQILA
jgi:hypothetical protein